jgi:hypothetical protein
VPGLQVWRGRAIVLTPAKGLFYCFSAKKGGDCIAIVARVMNVGSNDAPAS